MILYGRRGNNDFYGFYTEDEKDLMTSYVELSNEEHMKIINEANEKGMDITPNSDGYPTLTEYITSEEDLKRNEINSYLDYLKETDWYAIRFADTGEPIPEEIKEERENARIRISELRA